MPDLVVDMVVLGAGVSGLTTAAVVAKSGREVMVLERAPAIGGSAALSGGYLWTAPDVETIWRENPTGDRVLGRALVETYPDALSWVEEVGAPVLRDVSGVYKFGSGKIIDIVDYLRRCAAIVRGAGGRVLCDVEPLELLRDNGRVVGVRVKDRDGITTVGASATVLATGGFQADPELRARYIHPNARSMLLRSNPFSAGSGMRLALEVGAALVDRMSGFYGHLICAPTRHFTHTDFLDLTQYYSTYGVLINRSGERFTDESRGDHLNSQAVVRQDGATAALVFDERIRRTYVVGRTVDGNATIDRFATAKDAGALTATAASIPELAHLIAAWGVDEQRACDTLMRYNAAAGTQASLSPPRRDDHVALDQVPLHAIAVQPAITFTHGGIRINEHAQALRADGSPITGLFAVGADSGGTYDGTYAGGLALGCCFGIRAARFASSQAMSTRASS